MLIKCKECDNQLSDIAKSCPHCGYIVEKNKTGFMQWVGFVIVLIIAIPFLQNLILGDALVTYKDNIKVTEIWTMDGDYEIIKGVVRNEGDKVVSNVKLTAYYYDGYGKILDSKTVYVNNSINPSSNADFEITHKYSTDEKKYELKLEGLEVY